MDLGIKPHGGSGLVVAITARSALLRSIFAGSLVALETELMRTPR